MSARRRTDVRIASGGMSPTTRGFLQKICYRRAASVDMTQHGFINDSKVTPVNLLLKPLRKRLEKIVGPGKIPTRNGAVGTSSTKKRTKGYYVCKNLNRIDSQIRMVTSTDSARAILKNTATKISRRPRRITFKR